VILIEPPDPEADDDGQPPDRQRAVSASLSTVEALQRQADAARSRSDDGWASTIDDNRRVEV
jgi:hypothetical protein